MLVRSYMSAHPITLRTDSDYRSALRTMQERSIHHLPVLDAGNRLAGIVAERDLLLAAMHYGNSGVDIADVMHREVVTVRANAPITHAASLMVKHAIGGLPVVDAEDRVIGVITERDVFRAFVTVLESKTARTGDLDAVAAAEAADRRATTAVPPPRSRAKARPTASRRAPKA